MNRFNNDFNIFNMDQSRDPFFAGDSPLSVGGVHISSCGLQKEKGKKNKQEKQARKPVYGLSSRRKDESSFQGMPSPT